MCLAKAVRVVVHTASLQLLDQDVDRRLDAAVAVVGAGGEATAWARGEASSRTARHSTARAS
jgi:hypothetical protein